MTEHKMQKFCYKCGKSPENQSQLIVNLCQQCYIELHPLLKFPQLLHLKICKKCSRYFFKNNWVSSHLSDLEDILNEALISSIPNQIENQYETEISMTPNVSGNLENVLKSNLILVDIQANGTAHETFKPYIENYNGQKIELTFSICPSCLSLKRGEYQAVLHIIARSREMTEQERDFILSLTENESVKSIKLDQLAYISKFTMKKGKITFFIGSEKFARSLASSFSYNLGGLIKETYKFGSHKIPKEVKQNKLYISVYLPTFVKGDLLSVKNSPLYVIKVQGKKVTCLNLINYERVNLSLKFLKKVEILRYSNQLRSFLYFSQIKDTIQLMDLKTYQIYEVSNSPKYSELEVGQYINGFEVNGQIYLIQ